MDSALDRFSFAVSLLPRTEEPHSNRANEFAELYKVVVPADVTVNSWFRSELKRFADTIIETTRTLIKDELMLEQIAAASTEAVRASRPTNPQPTNPGPITFGARPRGNTAEIDERVKNNRVYQLACDSLSGKSKSVEAQLALRGNRIDEKIKVELRASLAPMTEFDDNDDSDYISYSGARPVEDFASDADIAGDNSASMLEESMTRWQLGSLAAPDDAEIVHRWST